MRKSAVLFFVLVVLLSFVSGAGAKTTHDFFIYLSPLPDARFVPPQSVLIFRAGDELMHGGHSWISAVQVKGERSGIHRGFS